MNNINSYRLSVNSWWPPGEDAASEFMAYNRHIDEEETLAQFDKVSGACAKIYTNSDAGMKIANFLGHRIKRDQPTSMIRLGDADGNVLFSRLGLYSEMSEYCLQKISKIYFGDKRVMLSNLDFFAESVVDAIKNADVIGGPERGTLVKSFHTHLPDLDVRGMCGMRGVYNYLAKGFNLGVLGDSIWASTWYSRQLLPYFEKILNELPYLGLITCYPQLGELIQKKYAVGRVETILVPMQASIAKNEKNINHYPDAYFGILDSIRPPRQGAVYLIAAGILSKPYGTTVKSRGGIAVDIGSTADIWMGAITRPGVNGDFVNRWRLA
jgi:hypothetical protein